MIRVERIKAIELDKRQAAAYAARLSQEEMKTRAEKVKDLGGGSFGRAFAVELAGGKRIVVKFLRAADMLEKETFDLELLRRNCPVKMPRVLFLHKADERIPVDCYGMERIEGHPVLYDLGFFLASEKKRRAFAEIVTNAQHVLHQCTSSLFGDTLSPQYETWRECYRPFAEAVFQKAEEMFSAGKIAEKIVRAMRAAWEEFEVIFSERTEKACLIHGDLNVGNIMIDNCHRVTGFIDPLNCMYADREYDLFQFDNLTGKRFFLSETYRQKYSASKYFDQKLAFYGLWNEVFCYIKSGVLVNIIMNPLVKNMYRQIEKL